MLALEGPVCLFAGTAGRGGGELASYSTVSLGVRVGGDTRKRSNRLNTWHLEEECSTQGSWLRGLPGGL